MRRIKGGLFESDESWGEQYHHTGYAFDMRLRGQGSEERKAIPIPKKPWQTPRRRKIDGFDKQQPSEATSANARLVNPLHVSALTSKNTMAWTDARSRPLACAGHCGWKQHRV